MVSSCCRSVRPSGGSHALRRSSIELIEELVEVLAWKHSRGVHSGVLCSQRFPQAAVKRFAQGCLRGLSMF